MRGELAYSPEGGASRMAKGEKVVWVQLATRIPKVLHRKLKLHCVTAEVSVMDFVTKAIGEKLAASSGTPTKGVKPSGRPSR
jgi:predicted HicB family RNase H-like nuclease